MPATPYISSQMSTQLRSRIILSLILILWTTACLPALTLGAGGYGSVQIAAGQDLGTKLQYGGGGGLDVLIPIFPWLDVDIGLAMTENASSDVSGGFAYDGFLGTCLSVAAQAHGIIARWENVGSLAAGGGIGIGGALASYNDTTLYFFYPECQAAGFLDFTPASLPALTVRFLVPVRALLRKDMDYTLATGAGLGILYHIPGTS